LVLLRYSDNELRCLEIAKSHPVGELCCCRLGLADLAPPAVFDDRDLSPDRLAHERGKIFRAARPPLWVARLALLELGVGRRLLVADLVIAIIRPWLPPPRGRRRRRRGPAR